MNSLKLIQFSLILVLYSTVYGQVNISPGVGYESVKLGMKSSSFKAIVGEPAIRLTAEEEQKNYEDNGYDHTRVLPFIIDFDVVYAYSNNNTFGIWKAYFKKEKLVYLNLSSFLTTIEISTSITVNDSLKFYDGLGKMEAVLGKNYIKTLDPDNYVVYTYLTQGIRLLFEGTKLRGIYLFKPLKGKKAIRIAPLLEPVKRTEED